MSTIAFLGAGNMAQGMVLRLLEAGHAVRVYNRTAERAAPLVEAGARPAETPAAAAEDAELIVSMVADDAASHAVWLGAGGALMGEPPAGALAVECSTLSVGWVRDLARHAEDRGLRYLDCPVTGIPAQARAGELVLLVGGDAATVEAARPVLSAFSRDLVRFGEVGAGTAYKLVVNMMGAVQIAALAEALLVAVRAGLDLGTVAGALAEGAAASPIVKRLAPRMAAGEHDEVTFSGRLRCKDTAYGLDLAAEVGQATPTSAIAGQLFGLMVARGWGERNETKVIDALR